MLNYIWSQSLGANKTYQAAAGLYVEQAKTEYTAIRYYSHTEDSQMLTSCLHLQVLAQSDSQF